ncbi:hypothetical protein ABH15_04810 [Methanoculleus taiwanensis]|uniref:Uncharacterized protein n=1 Tax=Methanoculleus taiwanensis TaxID=1550565 RepID=A0A498H0P1_9EURY|nr:hypothetical protein [Methanoculleus taiwanensis]RXE55590.1 hypothetical protein ABH15_04810 [Methanoculleus taiwanensis]
MQSQKIAIVAAILIQGLAVAGLLVGVAAGAHGVSAGADAPWSTIRHPGESPEVSASFYPILGDDVGQSATGMGIHSSRLFREYL